MRISVEDAARDFHALIAAVRSGEAVVITDGGIPVVRMEVATRSGPRFGLLTDVLKGPIPDFTEPMSEDELVLWEGRDEGPL